MSPSPQYIRRDRGASVTPETPSGKKADARLIALAPSMYEALRSLAAVTEQHMAAPSPLTQHALGRAMTEANSVLASLTERR